MQMRVMKRREMREEKREMKLIDIPLQKQNVSRRSSKGICVALIIAFVLTFAAVQTGAALELNWADGIWQNAAGTPTCLIYDNSGPTDDENLVAYGRRLPSCPPYLDLNRQTAFGFDGSDAETITSGVDFDLGDFTHYNTQIYIPDDPFTTVELSVTLSFYIDAGNPNVLKTINYTFDLDETPNSVPCVYPSDRPCADRVLVLNTIPNETFWIGGIEYTLHIVGFVPSGEVTPVDEFITQEQQRNDAVLVAELVVAGPGIEIEKATNGIDADDPLGPYIPMGDPVSWTYNVTNVGAVNLTGVGVIDDQGVTVNCPKNTLLVGENMTCTANGTATAGQYANIGNASGVGDGSSVFDTDPSHYFGCDPDLNITKVANRTEAAVGDIIKYWYNVTNTGNVNLTDLTVTDSRLGNIPMPSTPLAPNDVARGTENYTVTELDICKPIVNNATVNATDPCSQFVENISDDVTVTAPYTADLMITKAANRTEATVGDIIKYWYNVTNTGNVNLTDLTVTDSRLGNIPMPSTPLAPNDVARGTENYTVTELDICKPIVNNATANATDPCSQFVENISDDVTVTTPYTTDLMITKAANRTEAAVGDIIKYWYNVTNTGNVNLTDLTVTDSRLGDIPMPSTPLAPNDVARGTENYTVTELDICKPIVNNATANATGPCTEFVENISDDVTVTTPYTTDLMITKAANRTEAAVGDIIKYWYNVTNTGNVNLTDLTVTDSRLGIVSLDKYALIPNDVARGTKDYTVLQGDVCLDIVNNATANATGPCTEFVENISDDVTVTTPYTTDLMITKAANRTEAAVGDIITYWYNVTNTGNVNLTDLTVTDSRLGIVSLDKYALIPNDVARGTKDYTVLQGDVCLDIVNNATANATDPCSQFVENISDDVTVTTPYTADLMITKAANRTEATVGDIIKYWYNVTNTGNVNLTDLTVTDSRLGIVSLDKYALIPNDVARGTKDYTVLQGDVCLDIVNNATANATGPCTEFVENISDDVTVTTPYTADLMITKAANRTEATVGDIITYWYNVTNTGNVNLTDLTVTDSRLGIVSLDKYALIPNDVARGTKDYTVLQGDVCLDIVNNATANATGPCTEFVENISDDVTVTTPYTADLMITKAADRTEATVGDIIKYWYNVTNTGNVNLTDLTVTDSRLGIVSLDKYALIPNDVARGTKDYTVLQGDVCLDIVNNATANATGPCTEFVENISDDVTVTTPYTTDLMITKAANRTEATVGDIITYWYNVTNTGNVNLTDLTVTDSRLGIVSLDKYALIPNDVARGTKDYTVLQGDVCLDIVNNATANATGPCTEFVENISDDVTVTTPYTADLMITKAADRTEATVGDIIKYWYNVTNTGNVNLTDLTVTDSRLGIVSLDKYALIPNDVARGTKDYTVLQGDACLDIVNNATANATGPCTEFVENISDDVTVTTPYTADLMITKAANRTEATVGDIIKYWYNVTNTGNVNLTDLTVTDSRLGIVSLDKYALIPNDVARGTKDYTVLQGDACLDIVNNATANATGPCTEFVENISDDVTVTTPYTTDLMITKAANRTEATVGDIITYWYNVTNTGNVNLTDLTVTDSRLGIVSLDKYALIPNDVARGTKDYTVLQGDVCLDIVNNATANATGPCTEFVENISDDVTVTTPYTADLMITKAADRTEATVGDIIKYWYNVTNTGNVNLTDLTVTDSRLGIVSLDKYALIPNDVARGTKDYTVLQGDACLDIVNNATANATGPCTEFVENISDDVTVTTPYTADLMITKAANRTEATVGDIIKYWYNVTNTGNVNLTDLTVTDSRLGIVSLDKYALIPNDVARGTKDYTVLQGDACLDIVNNATANATGPCTEFVENISDDVTVTTPYTADLMITKAANRTEATVGDIIKYWYNVTNTGNVNLTDLTVTDSRLGIVSLDKYALIPNDVARGTKDYTVLQGDVCLDIVNNATANATGPCTEFVENISDDVTVTTPYTADLMITKAANRTEATVGDIIKYWYNVTNTGNVNLTDLTVTDSRLGDIPMPSTPLAPNDVARGTENYTVTELDICKPIVNNATANATDLCSQYKENISADVTVTTPCTADIMVSKTALLTGTCPGSDPLYVKINDTVTYCYNVTNTGYVKLTNVTVVDDIYGSVKLANDTLAPGESTEGTVPHTVVELDKPSVTNIANATGTDPFNGTVNDTDDCTILVKTQPEVELEKTGSPTIVAPGGNVTYTINYTNTGAVTLHNVVITEHYPKGVTFISADPAPDAGTNNVWTIGKPLEPGDSGTIVIEVKVPEQIDLSFTETGSVIGEGLVMVTKDLTTEQKPYSLRNRVTLSAELAPVKQIFNRLFTISAYATTKVSGVPGTSLGITESGSGVYSSDEILDLETKNKTIILQKTTHAEYKPTSFNFSDSFSVNFTNKWKQDICSRNMVIDAAIHKKISDATYIDDETISRVDKDKSVMNFDTSFNGSLYIGARTKYTAISETYIGEFDVLQTIQIAKGPIPTPAPTPTPTPIWLPCPYNASPEMNMTEEAEPTP